MAENRLKRRVMPVLLTAAGILAAVLLYGFLSSLSLRTVYYSVEAKVFEPVRLVHLSDLHNRLFGEQNEKLIAAVTAQQPDLIIMSGDMLNADDPNTDIVTELIQNLCTVAPVYFGYGNHEKSWEQAFEMNLRPILEEAGAVVVDNDYVDIELNGTALRIGGYMAYYPVSHMTTHDEAQQKLEHAFAADFENTERLKILINHIPTGWVDWEYVDKYPVDLVFSGHYHGGTIRIPYFNQGLYAPYVGWFPPFTEGVFIGKEATCILSSGLGNEHSIPRVYNPPEIVVVDLVPPN